MDLRPLLAALAIVSCKSSDPVPPAPSPPDLQIVSAGGTPRELLRYHAPVGTTRKLEIATDVELVAGEMGGPMPTQVVAMTLVVEAILPAGDMLLRATIDEVTARDNPASSVPAAAITGPLEAMKGIVIRGILSPTGRLYGARVDRGTKALPAAIDVQLASLIASMEGTMLPLPDDPVGAGAVWRTSRPVERNGLQMKAVSSVSLGAITGDTISFTLESDVHGQDQQVQQEGIAIEVKDIVGSGAGKGTIDLRTLGVTSDLGFEFRAEMLAPGDASPTTMKMTTTSRVRPL